MKKLKVYLAKSNRADFELVSRTRNHLKRFSQIELLEWTEGEYSNSDVHACDVIIFITENPASALGEYRVGKGLYTQLVDFRDTHGAEFDSFLDKAFILNHFDQEIYLDSIVDYRITDSKSWTNYAAFETDHMCINMWSLSAFPSKYYEYREEILEKPNQNILLICNF